MKKILLLALSFALLSCSKRNMADTMKENGRTDTPSLQPSENVRSYAAPAGADLSPQYQVTAEGVTVPVYHLKVAPDDEARRWAAMDDKVNSHTYFEDGAFAYFDMRNTVEVSVTVPFPLLSAKILPASVGITLTSSGRTVKFRLSRPQNLTIEINGQRVSSLHLFANSFETDVPVPTDPNVLYFGPGMHRVSSRVITGANKTVYIAGGAIVQAVIDPSESYTTDANNLRKYVPAFTLSGNNIRVRGRGILDASACTNQSRELIYTTGHDIAIEGIIIKDPPVWTMPVMNSRNVLVDNVKILGYRANSDGIDICNSTDVTIRNCFVRSLDDLIVVKTLGFNNGNTSERILVENCILWNEVAHALSIGAEVREDISDVTFRNCDIIHDRGREWALRIYNTDKGIVRNVKFEQIRIEESRKLMSLWIGLSANWSTSAERGHIRNVTFSNIVAQGNPLTIELTGFDAQHQVEGIRFDNILMNGSRLQQAQVAKNTYVSGLTFMP